MKDNLYCPYMFNGASLQPNNIVLPCGQYMHVEPFKKIVPIKEARHSEYMNNTRQDMLNGIPGKGCQCPAEEKAGIGSMRQSAIKRFGVDLSTDLKVVEIFFDNVCNLKCRSCGSNNSHLWYEDEKQLYGETLIPNKYVKNYIYKDLDHTKLQIVDLYGGEPMLSQDADDFLKMLVDDSTIKQIELDLSTNGTILPKENMLKALLSAKKIKLQISIDAHGPLNDFIRHGSDFDQLVENLNFYKTLLTQRPEGSSSIRIHSAVSIYNVNMLDRIDKFVQDNYPEFLHTVQVVQFPVFLSIKNTPAEYKAMIRDTLDNIKYKHIIEYMMQPSENHFGHFINFHNQLNQIRNEDFKDLNRLLSDYISNYKQVPQDSKVFFIEKLRQLQSDPILD